MRVSIPIPRFLAPALTSCIIVLGTAAAGSGDADYVLTIYGADGKDELVCTKSRRYCQEAQEAIEAERWRKELPRDISTTCRPSPSCFDQDSNYIRGFNLPGEHRR